MQSGGDSVRRNFGWMLAGNLVYAACQWGFLVVLSKLGNPQMVGRFVFGLAVTAPIVLFTNLSLRQILATDVASRYRFGHYIALRLAGSGLAATVIAVVVAVAGFGSGAGIAVLLVGLAKLFESGSDIIYGWLQSRERMSRIGRSLIYRGTLSVIALALGTGLTGRLEGGLSALALAWLAVLLVHDLPAAGRACSAPAGIHVLRPIWDGGALVALTGLALPLGLSSLVVTLTAQMPRYFVKSWLGEYELGLFGAMAYISTAGVGVVIALGQAASPRIARLHLDGEPRGLYRLLGRLLLMPLALGTGGIVAAWLLGRELLTVLYREEYAERPEVFLWLMIGAAFLYLHSFLNYPLIAFRLMRLKLVVELCGGVLLMLLLFRLVPDDGLVGAAMAMLATSAAIAAVKGLAVWRGIAQTGKTGPRRSPGDVAEW